MIEMGINRLLLFAYAHLQLSIVSRTRTRTRTRTTQATFSELTGKNSAVSNVFPPFPHSDKTALNQIPHFGVTFAALGLSFRTHNQLYTLAVLEWQVFDQNLSMILHYSV